LSQAPGHRDRPRRRYSSPAGSEKFGLRSRARCHHREACIDVSEEEALDYVGGYTTFNDISARDVIRSENNTGIHLMGKSFPGYSPMGQYLVTADELPDRHSLKVRLSVNGEVRQDSNLGYMIFSIRAMIAYWSQMVLQSGDVLNRAPRGASPQGES